MSGESIYNVLQENISENVGPYTGKYKKHMKEASKPTYSTFYQKGKEYDGTHSRYFKQRDAVIGAIVNEAIDPKNFLRAGEGVKHVVPPVKERKVFKKAPLDHGICHGDDVVGSGGRARAVSDTALPNDQRKVYDETKDLSGGKYFGTADETGDLEDKMHICVKDRELTTDFLEGSMKDRAGNGEAGFVLAQGSEDDYGQFEGQKDFVRSNILQVTNMVPKRRKDQPEHPTCRKTFGRVPLYLGRVKQEVDNEKMRLKSIENLHIQQKLQQMKKYVYRLDEAERTALLSNLKTQLNEKSIELNKMPFVKDTFNQVVRRSQLEKDIKEIEMFIAKLDKDAVFIYNGDPRCVHWTKDAALKEAVSFASQHSN